MTAWADTWGHRALKELFGSEVRVRLIAWFCRRPDEPTHLRDLARRTDLPYTAVRREVLRLARLGMLRKETVGRSTRYHLVDSFPLLPGLRQTVDYAIGAFPRLREALADEEVEVAFIFGSVAKGTDEAGSDVDLLVVGEIEAMRLSALLTEIEQDIGREISPVSYRDDELRGMLASGSSFLSSVLDGPKIFVKGGEHELRELTGGAAHQTA